MVVPQFGGGDGSLVVCVVVAPRDSRVGAGLVRVAPAAQRPTLKPADV